MKLLAAAAAAATVIGVSLASVPAAEAQYYYPPVYAPPVYVPPPVYRPYAPRPYYRPAYRRNPCPPYWTVQSGVCKPYRGY